MQKDIMVSVICSTYNHEKFIARTLEGILMQKTDFPFEILVHDDASKDKTAQIIRQYEKKYPDKIKPIYQTENQYSKGIPIGKTFQFPRVKGKYIAICEGDDYWIDEYKLQKQVDALETHPEADICATAAWRETADGKRTRIGPAKEDTVLSPEQVIAGGGGYVATCSLLYRASINGSMPEFRRRKSYDYTLQMHGALRGGMVFLKEEMSVYRWKTAESWTVRMNRDKDKFIRHEEEIIETLECLNEETDGRFGKTVESTVKDKRLVIAEARRDYAAIRSDELKEAYDRLSKKRKIKMYMECRHPKIYKLLRKVI